MGGGLVSFILSSVTANMGRRDCRLIRGKVELLMACYGYQGSHVSCLILLIPFLFRFSSSRGQWV